ncbi:GNAT family N-acetyltransferase [Nigerium massiliense]|uniref:GNAT family N-acetyltransferase n=1 Tax=Nigerium massiliense TaxID=1522317 RepID=UPI00058DE8CB|nr:N-acetyltransferase [Nigerium massiliense]
MRFSLDPLSHDEVPAYVQAHLAMTVVTYAHLVGPEFAANRWSEVEPRIAEVHHEIDDADRAEAAGETYRRHLVAHNDLGGIVGVMAVGGGVEQWEFDEISDRWTPPAIDYALGHLYTVPGIHGTGLPQQMLDAGLPDRRPAFLWCIADNARAVAFYRRNGFVPDGLAVAAGDWWSSLPMIRMVRQG